MTGVLSGFAVIIGVIAVGWFVARTYVLGEHGVAVLSRLVFFVATPALLLDNLARTSLGEVLSPVFVISAVSAVLIAALYWVIAALWLKRSTGELVIGSLSASYVNSANLGIPIALYVLGDLGFVTPLLLFQVVLYSPVALTILDNVILRETSGAARPSAADVFVQSLRNPLVVAGLFGVVLAALPWKLPEGALQPVHLIGQAAVPGALLAYGMSLYGVRILQAGVSPRREIMLASVLKLLAHPALAYILAVGVFSLDGHALFTVVVAACLPTAQNVYVYAARYGVSPLLARDAAVVTTIGSIPLLLAASALLAA